MFDLHKSFALLLVSLVSFFSPAAVQAATIEQTTHNNPAANQYAAWYDRFPVPTGAYYRIGNAEYFYGTLNDRSQILPGVTWQVNGESGLLLKGYSRTPRAIIYWINRVLFQPIRVESN